MIHTLWWKILLFLWIAFFSGLAVLTPVTGNLSQLSMYERIDSENGVPAADLKHLPIQFTKGSEPDTATTSRGFITTGYDINGAEIQWLFSEKPADFDEVEGYMLRARYDRELDVAAVSKVLSGYPFMTFPFIPGLEERSKIIFFHVPMAWMTVIAFLVAMWYGIGYLRSRELDQDAKSAASAGLGLLFCVLAATTGAVWAKFNWGSFWNWDPRQTSIFVLLLVYGAYFALRPSVDNEEKRASLSAVYSIIAFVTVPFFIFIMPRIMPGLHPGSADDVNSGPVMSSGGMDSTMRVILYALTAGFIALYAWLMSIRMRLYRIIHKAEAPVGQ